MKNEEVFELCKNVFKNDKTSYSYYEPLAANRFGFFPKKGKRWNCPWEIAEAFVKEHFPDRHQELYE